MNPEGVPMAATLWLCAAVFLLIGRWAGKRREPMHFWSGTTVPPEAIRDIPAYNRACARMWWAYGAVYVLAGAAGLFSIPGAGILAGAAIVPGLPTLVAVYRRIYRKYERQEDKNA